MRNHSNQQRREGKRRMRKLAALLAPLAIACLVAAGTASASVEGCSNGQVLWQGTCQAPETPITICHVAGLASDPANYITLNITLASAVGVAGHFGENGTPNAGHEQDTLGACNPPPPVDVCPNLEGNQSEVPPGYHLGEDENGRPACLPNPPPPPIEVTAGVTFTEATCTSGPSFTLLKTNPGLRFYNVEGVFVDGKPVAGGTYTITPIVDEGFVVVGQSVFVHTFAPAPANCGSPPPPVGAASVICDSGAKLYRVSGTIDGFAADSVTPASFAGNTKGTTLVEVKRGDTTFRTSVVTNGDCDVSQPPAPPPPTTLPPIAAAAVTTPVAPAAKPKPKPVRKPVAKAKPKPKPKHKAKPKHSPDKRPHKAPFTL